MSKKIILPEEITAENGAKCLLMGEFSESIDVTCPDCSRFEGPENDCSTCGGSGDGLINVPISWTTIKDIYKKIVEHFGEELEK